MDWLWLIILALVSISFPVGICMVLYGLLGRRINKHPICLRCTFDLVGHMRAC